MVDHIKVSFACVFLCIVWFGMDIMVWLTMLRLVLHFSVRGMVWQVQIRRYGVQRCPATALHTAKGELRKENNLSKGTKRNENS